MTSIKNEEVDASSSLAPGSSGDDGVAVCYLCLDGGLDDADQPLRRDCACRGTDAGFVHLSCLTNYAETKSKQASDMNEFITPWHTCPSCHQYYQNELAIDIANRFVPFVRRQYPHNTPKQVEALFVKLRALQSMLDRLQPVQKREFGVTANVLLSMIDRMKGEVSPLPRRYSRFEAIAHNAHGRIALDEGTEESARRAVAHFEKYLKVCKTMGVKACQDLYELRVAELGEKDYLTFVTVKLTPKSYTRRFVGDITKLDVTSYAKRVCWSFSEAKLDALTIGLNVQKANRRDEARELLTKLLATSKQVLGTNHKTTKNIELSLK
jgi:hypothetical protein